MGKIQYTIEDFKADCALLAREIIEKSYHRYKLIYAIPQGGVVLGMKLSELLGIPLTTTRPDREDRRSSILVVDDVSDSGKTLEREAGHFATTAVLHRKTWSEYIPTFCVHDNCENFIIYWWEGSEERSIDDSVIRQLQFIGEDPTREGLVETPKRVVKSWDKIYGGYDQKPEDVLKIFEEGACDEMVLLKDIEFYSTCEHHMLPFYGTAHIAYIPDKKIVGISKLARLLEIYTRRLQIQERIGDQVTGTLMEQLAPKGAACILEAQHFCMTSRGVEKQNSIMVTSSLKGAFLDDRSARAEFIQLAQRRSL